MSTCPARLARNREYAVVSHNAIVGDVGIRHEQVVVSDGCHAMALGGATIDRTELAKRVVFADDQFGVFTGIFEILRITANHGMRMNATTLTDLGITLQHSMAADHHIVGEADSSADNGIRPNVNISPQLRARINDGGGMNGHGVLLNGSPVRADYFTPLQ